MTTDSVDLSNAFANAIPFIVSLSNAPTLDSRLVGAKALRLGQILALNYKMPLGFCVTTSAFETFLSYNAIGHSIRSQVQQTKDAGLLQIEELSRQITSLIQSSEFPKKVVDSIKQACVELWATELGESTPVAVRSSGTAEDLPGASFAGQYSSFLFVSGLAAILDAVKKCWASLWTARAILYRHTKHIEEDRVSMGVIVHLAINATVSGVVFTVDPVTGKDNVIVQSSWGLGSRVVSGECVPDTFVIRRTDRQIVERNVVDKQFMEQSSNAGTGTEEIPVPASLRRAPSLDVAQVDNLVHTALALEQYYNGPQDIEWAFSNGELWVLQTRPITALPNPFPIKWEKESDRTIVWTRGVGVTERLVDPVTPMSFSLFQRMVKTGWNAAMQRLPLPMLEGEAELRLFNHYLYWNVDVTVRPKPRKLIPFIIKFLFTLTKGVNLWNERLPKYLSAVRVLQDCDLQHADLVQLKNQLDAICNLFAESFIWEVHLGTFLEIFGDIFLKLVPRLTGCTDAEAMTSIQGFRSITLDMDRRLWMLTTSIRESPVLFESFKEDIDEYTIGRLQQLEEGREWLDRFREFLGDYGHHSPKDDWFFPDWSANPLLVLNILRTKLRLPKQDFDAARDQTLKEQKATVDSIRNRLKHRPIEKALFNWLLSAAHRWMPLKEDRQFYIKLTSHQLRLVLLEIEKRFRGLRVLSEENDVFFVSLEEVHDTIDQLLSGKMVDLRELALTRRREWQGSFALSPPPRIKGDLVKDHATEYSGSRRVLRGTPASRGLVTGVARVIRIPEEFEHFCPGEILVTQSTNPCWAPLFGYSKAVVTNYGGVLCHCAVLARELGIPAVVGTAFATSVIRTGSTITVDGTKGVVLIQ